MLQNYFAKRKINKLDKEYNFLHSQAFQVSKINRSKSDLLIKQADSLLKEIAKIKKSIT